MDFFATVEENEPVPTTRDYAAELNPEQYAAVTAPFGPALVLAGAGSGKTRTLTYRVAWLLDQGVRPSEILLLTFTNKAAREMLTRVEDLTGANRQHFWGGTFHHIGQRLLRRFGSPVGVEPSFNIIDEGDADSLLGEAIRQVDPGFTKIKENPKARVISSAISYSRNTLRPLEEVIGQEYPHLTDHIEPITRFARKYEQNKRQQRVLDYDDLLELWLRLLKEHAPFREYCSSAFSQILVDEYQDTNRLQSAIIDTIGSHHQIMAVGDDAQCIYTWRGAEFANIIDFPERHPQAKIYKIETNYRSSPEILHFANGILDGQIPASGYGKTLRPVRPSGPVPRIISSTDAETQAECVLELVQALHQQGRAYSDIAILYRAHFQAMSVQSLLAQRNVPFEITSGVRFFEQAHIRDVAAHLRLAVNPRDTAAFSRLLNLLPKIGDKTAQRLHQLTSSLAEKNQKDFFDVLCSADVTKKIPAAAKDEWSGLSHTLADLRRAVREEETPVQLVRLAIDGWYGTYMRTAFANAHSREEDLNGLVGFASKHESITDMLAQLVLLSSEGTGRQGNRPEDALRLTTVHQSKGLEFPVIILIGAADGLFPLNRSIENGSEDEERRLFYVAATRAMEELYVMYPRFVLYGGPPREMTPSRFIATISPHCYEMVRDRIRRRW